MPHDHSNSDHKTHQHGTDCDQGHAHTKGAERQHEDGHPHSHGLFGHHHHHHGSESGNIATAFWLNFSFTIIEFIGGWLTNSVAIMADAMHDLGDTLAIAFAWFAAKVAGKEATPRYSYLSLIHI